MNEYDDLLARVRAGEKPKAPMLLGGGDEYDSLLAQVRGKKPDPMPRLPFAQAAAWNGSFADPAREAEKQRLAIDLKKELGEDWAPKLIDPPEAKRRLMAAQMDHALRGSDDLQRWFLDDPDNAMLLSADQAKRFADISRTIKNFPGGVASGLLIRPVESAYGMAAMPFDWSHQAAKWLGLEREGTQSPVGRWLRNRGGDVGALAHTLSTLAGEGEGGNIESGVASGAESMGSSLGALGVGILTRDPVRVTSGLISALTAGKSYLAGMDETGDAVRATGLAATDATAEYVTERFWGMKQLFEIPGLKHGVGEFLKGAGNFAWREMVGEQIATVWQDANQWLLANPDKSLDDYLAERPDAAIQTAIATAIGGGGQIALLQAVKARGQAEQKKLFDALHAGGQDSELRQKLPEKYRDFVEKATKDGPLEKVYIPAEQFTTYFQSAGIDPARAAADLNAANYAEAAELGTDVVVPMADFATLIAGTDHYAGLQDHLRLNPGMATAYEYRLQEANREESDREVEAALEKARAEIESNTLALGIKDQIVGQLIGRYTPDTADTMATIFAAGLSNLSKQSGIAPEVLMERYGLKVETPMPDVLKRMADAQLDIDPLIDMIRAGQGPSDAQAFGQSLVEFIRRSGGLKNEWGELVDADHARRPFQKNIVQENGLDYDYARELAVEAGYLPEDADIPAFLDAIDQELRGDPVYSPMNEDTTASDRLRMLEELAGVIERAGIDLSVITDNAEVRRLLARPQQDGQVFEQGQSVWRALRDAALRTLRKEYEKPAMVQAKNGDEIIVSYGGLKHALNVRVPSPQETLLALHIREAIRSADKESTFPDKDGRTDPVSTTTYRTDVDIDGVMHDAVIFVRNHSDGNRYYDHVAIERKSPEGVQSESAASDKQATAPTQNHSGLELSLGEIAGDFKQYNQPAYFQKVGAGETARGYLRIGPDRQMTIGLTEKADLSTFVHETGHLWLEMMGDIAAMPEASRQVKDDYAKVLAWLGVESRDQITVEHHEKFARGNEAYLMEGNAPSPALRSVFSRVKEWMLGIYKKLLALNVKLSPEIREVFDRIYASEAEIEAARRESASVNLLLDAATAKMSEAEFAAYRDLVDRAAASEKDALRARLMRDMMKGREQWWKDELAKVREEVAAEVDAVPVYQAFKDLTVKPEDGGVRLSKADLVRRYGETYLARLPRAFQRIYAVEGGMNADMLAPVYGFDSGDALIKALVEMRPRKPLIEAEAAQRMRERHGDALADGAEMAQAVDEAMASEARADVIAVELRHARRLWRQGEPARKASRAEARDDAKQARAATEMPPVDHFRQAARGHIGQQRITDINAHAYLTASRKANRAAFAAMAKNDYAEAAAQKQKELLNHFLFMEAIKRLKEVEKAREYLRKFDKKETRERIGKAGADYLEQIDALQERYELRNVSKKAMARRANLALWAEQQTNAGNPINVPDELLDDAKTINWRQATVDEFMALSDMVKQIEHMARLKNKLLTAADKRDLQDIALELSESIRASKPALPKRLEPKRGIIERAQETVTGFLLANRKLSSLFRQMDSGNEDGPLWRLLGRGMNAAGAKEAAMIEEATEKLIAINKPLLAMPGGTAGDARYIEAIGASLTRGGRLSVALNWGNEGNRDRIRQGFGWNDRQVQAILSTLTKTEMEAVQQTWDMIESYWPQIAEKEKRVTGVVPEKVDPVAFGVTSADGHTVLLRGGYYPIKYDAEASQEAQQHDSAEIMKQMMAGQYAKAATKRGHTKARQESVNRQVRLSLDVIQSHMVEVVHDLAWHEWIIDANKIINHKEVDAAIREHYGAQTVKEITDHITAIAVGGLESRDAIDRALMHFRANISAATMGLSMTTAFLQPFGLLQSMARVGVGPVMRGMMRWGGDVARMESTLAWVRGKSDFMRTRAKTMNREMHEIMGRLVQGKSKARQIYETSLFVMMQKMQLIADVPTWVGVYEKSLMQGKSEAEAIALADRAVIESQGSGQAKDLARSQRNHPFLTMFYSYFSATFQLVAEKTAKTNFLNPAQVAGWVADMALLIVIPAIGPALITAWLRGEGCGDDWEECAKSLAKETAGFTLGLLPGAREFSGTLQGFDYAGPPVGRVITDVTRFATAASKGELDEKTAIASTRLLGSVVGIPSTQIVRSYRGWQAWDGDEAPPTAILMGPPRKD